MNKIVTSVCRYSSPSVGVGAGERKVLHSVEGGVLFFAGEHTNVYCNANIQGAMETGRWAAFSSMQALEERAENEEYDDDD